MNFLYTLDNSYFPQLAISIHSLICNTSEKLNIYIVCVGLSNDDKRKLLEFENSKVEIIFLAPPKVPKKLVPDRGSSSQYFRLFIGKIFKGIDIGEVIYLDCDTLIQSNGIDDLKKFNFKGQLLGACLDPWSKEYRLLLHLEGTTKMLNSGVLVINVIEWKKRKIDTLFEKIIDDRTHFIQGDQGLLDEVINGNFIVLDPKFNAISSYFEMSYRELMIFRKPEYFYGFEDVQKAKRNPIIVHFTSSFINKRPWESFDSTLYGSLWKREYFELFNKKIKIYEQHYSIFQRTFDLLPRRLSISLLGFIQCTLRPIKLYLCEKLKKA